MQSSLNIRKPAAGSGARRASNPALARLQPVSVHRVIPFVGHASQIERRNLYASSLTPSERKLVIRLCQSTQQPSEHPFPEEEDFDLLSTKISELVTEIKEELRGCNIYLTGMMGSGKSTVGKMLANTMKYAFFDTDVMVEMAHEKKAVSEIFKEYGEDYFRNAESEVLKQLAPYRNLVISTGGGAVLKTKNWSYMQTGVVAWLNGPTELLAQRVAKDGIAKRPLLAGDGATEMSEEELFKSAQAKLDSLLEQRAQYYEIADLKISLEGYGKDAEKGAPTVVVMYRLLCALKKRIEDTKAEREAKRDFTIENNGEVPTMQVKETPNAEDA